MRGQYPHLTACASPAEVRRTAPLGLPILCAGLAPLANAAVARDIEVLGVAKA